MKIVFILPPSKLTYSACPLPPLGLAYLSACLLEYRNDIHIEIIDGFLLSLDEYNKKIEAIKADVIGVSTTMSQLNHALMIPNIVKEKNTEFIIGGAGAVTVPSSMLYEG